MQPKYLTILTLPLEVNDFSLTISRCRKERWSSYDFFIFYFIIIFVYLVYLFTFVFIFLANRQYVVY